MIHRCHAFGCQVPVDPRYFMCPHHWRRVPRPLKIGIWRHYRPGQEIDKRPSPAYLEAAQAAIVAVADAEGTGDACRAHYARLRSAGAQAVGALADELRALLPTALSHGPDGRLYASEAGARVLQEWLDRKGVNLRAIVTPDGRFDLVDP